MANKTTEDLRRMLFEAIDKVRSNSLEYDAAKSIIGLSKEIISSAKLDLDAEERESKGAPMVLTGKPGKVLIK